MHRKSLISTVTGLLLLLFSNSSFAGWSVMGAETFGFNGLWGSAVNDVFAVGEVYPGNVILHYDGTGWYRMSLLSDRISG